ncbi:MAG: hypothetical protein I8H68_07495 [Flavobacteriia bacterium]|nr:hypothetical protein [Flavobacteriia bacterium]
MFKINWNAFKVKNENTTKSFEELCYHLFCRSHEFLDGVRADFNQVGLETYPKLSRIENINVGFQSKFLENDNNYKQIEKSIVKAIETYPNELDRITIYLNIDIKISSKKAKDIENLAAKNNIEIDWFTISQFEIALSKPSNLDLAQRFFGLGDEYGFIKDNMDIEASSLIQSSELLDLPIKSDNVIGTLTITEKVSLLTGSPGGGKSLLVKKIFYDQAELGGSLSRFRKNKNLPMLINLKDCYDDSLENIIRHRQNDYKVHRKALSFIYIFDGLDELNESKAENVLQYIKILAGQSNTKNILISCRKGSLNKIKVSEFISQLKHYEIDNLTLEHIEKYFIIKRNKDKEKKLQSLKKSNLKLLEEINDIFMIRLLWETIESLDKSSSVIDLLQLKVMSQLKDVNHKSNIEQLDLLNPKDKQIMRLNEDLSYKFSRKYQYRFKHTELTKVVKKRFKRSCYKSLNEILNFNINAFFDVGANSYATSPSYIYHHRRYQEYFFARGLKKRFEKDIKILRKDRFIINSDFFDDVFLKYLESKYKEKDNIAGLILVKSIQFYQSNGDTWYVSDSETFIDNLVIQTQPVFEMLINDDVLNLRSYIVRDYSNALKFYENGKIPFAKEIANDSKMEWNFKEAEGNIFFKICIEQEIDYADFFIKKYRKFCDQQSKEETTMLQEISPYEHFLRAFFKVGLKHKINDLLGLINTLNTAEFVSLLNLLSENEFLPIVFSNMELRNEIINGVKNYKIKPVINNLSVYFFKKVLALNVTENQAKGCIAALAVIKTRVNRFYFSKFIKSFQLCYVIVGEEIFLQSINLDSIVCKDIIKCSELFLQYINLLREKHSFSRYLVAYRNKFVNTIEAYESSTVVISKLWAFIFYYANTLYTDFIHLSKVLKYDLDTILFFDQINQIDSHFLSNVFSESDIEKHEAELLEWKQDYSKFVDRCFLLSGIFSRIDSKKVIHYLQEGFSNSVVRHGWRKDIVVSEFLNDTFGEILKKRWFSKREVINLSKKLYNMNIKLYSVTDKDHTNYGVSTFLRSLSFYDTELAYEYLNDFKEKDLDWSVKNIGTTEILINDIRQNSIAYHLVREKVNSFSLMFDYKGELPRSHYFLLFSIEMEVLKSDFYDSKIKKLAFKHAFEAVEKVSGNFDYDRLVYEEYYAYYNEFCKLNEVENIIPKQSSNYIVISEDQFSLLIDQAESLADIKDVYEKFNDSLKYKIEIKDKEIWKKLIDKTFAITGEIKLFIETLEKYGIMLSGMGYSYNSDYLHLGSAYCMLKRETSQQMLQYLIQKSGYGGFYKMILIYIEMGDKENAKKLFIKFYDFCDLLLN